MKRKFIVHQPPISEKYRLLVDDINETATIAITTDVDKVWYNRSIIGQELSIKLETYTALSDMGITTVVPLGKYISIWKISKDEKKQSIWFIDHQSDLSFRDISKNTIDGYFSNNLFDEFERVEKEMHELFKPKFDFVELIQIDLKV